MEEKDENKSVKISPLMRLFLWLAPDYALKLLARRSGDGEIIFDKLHEALVSTKRVDLFKTGSNSRGFILVLDQRTALFFYQDGDHFIYDGWETGEYGKGEITILDNSVNDKDPYEIDNDNK